MFSGCSGTARTPAAALLAHESARLAIRVSNRNYSRDSACAIHVHCSQSYFALLALSTSLLHQSAPSTLDTHGASQPSSPRLIDSTSRGQLLSAGMEPSRAVYPALLKRSVFAAPDALLSSLLDREHVSYLSPSFLRDVPTAALFPLLSLTFATLESLAPAHLAALARALRDRAAAHPTLKLRLLHLLRHPSFASWRLSLVHRRASYALSVARLRAAQVEAPNTPAEAAAARNFLSDVALRLFHPAHGALPEQRFDTNILQTALVDNGFATREVDAARLAAKLEESGLVQRVPGEDTLETPVAADHGEAHHFRVETDQGKSFTSSLDFALRPVYEHSQQPGFEFPFVDVVHPLAISRIERDGDRNHPDMLRFSESLEHHSHVPYHDLSIQSVAVKKVFSSLSRPSIVELRRFNEGTVAGSDGGLAPMFPSLLVKKGDNLMKDHCVCTMFQVFNHIWRKAPAFATSDGIPHCYTYEVVPTSLQEGFMEAVSGLTPLGELKWLEWYERHKDDQNARTLINMVYSAAGAYAGGYVLGATDRHWDNIVIKDDTTLFHIDFSFILGEAPPIDAPRISIPPSMEKLFKAIKHNDTNLWAAFVSLTIQAFMALRKESGTVLRVAALMFGKAGHDTSAVEKFLAGKSGLNLEADDDSAGKYVMKKILGSSRHFKTKMKQFMHDVVNPAWYGFVQNGPIPAEGVMRLINKLQSENAVTQHLAKLAQEAKTEGGPEINVD